MKICPDQIISYPQRN